MNFRSCGLTTNRSIELGGVHELLKLQNFFFPVCFHVVRTWELQNCFALLSICIELFDKLSNAYPMFVDASLFLK